MTTELTRPALFAALLALAAGCDYAQKKELKAERGDAGYQAAIAAYQAGQIDLAEKEFEKVIKSAPANASARFQLACLLAEGRRDTLGAICQFREYIRLEPGSDKAAAAESRMTLCEKALARELSEKYALSDVAAAEAKAEAARKDHAAAEAKVAALERDLEDLRGKSAALARENERLRRMVSSLGEEEASDETHVIDARRILDDEEDGDRLRLSPDAKALFQDGEEDDARRAGSALIAEQTSGASGGKLTDLGHGSKTDDEAKGRPADRPATYVVEDGDTLYKIATRFYGRVAAWKAIREANKATISTDGRIKAGQRLVLP